MDSSQIFNLLKEMKEKADSAFSSIDIFALAEIKDHLLSIESGDRIHFKGFFDDFVDKLFKLGIGLPGEPLENFQIVAVSQPLKIKSARPKKNNFEQTFKLFIKCLKSELKTAKNYYFITLNYDLSQKYELLILHDDNYFVTPYKNCLQKQFENITVSTIKDFCKNNREKLMTGEADLKNYICLLLLKSKMNAVSEIEECIKNLKSIIKLFDSAESIFLRSLDTDESFYSKKILAEKGFLDDDFFDEIEYLSYTFLTNTELLYEEEKLIKLFFKDFGSPLLEYKLLERGNSGANVIEIRPKQIINDAQARRYIVKYRKLSQARKLNEEAKNFHKYLAFEGFSDYMCIHQKTHTYEGILYSYAKSDFEKFSYPFSTILNKPENEFHEKAPEITDRLFNIEEFKHWSNDKDVRTGKIKELFKPFIKSDVEDEIQKILDLKRNELENLELIQNYGKIINYEMTVSSKVCHGDLHTNNFFVDNKNIYLIDFGFTQFLPPVIDHAFLEASIKFNHIPRFIELDLLKALEVELLKDETFSAGYKFTSSNRKDLNYYLSLIQRIRVNANTLLSDGNKLEYLITLFIVTFKLIKYPDLNQLYALKSAETLSKKIVGEFKLNEKN